MGPNGDGAGWTISTLERHLSSVISELRLQTDQRFTASEKAVQAALQASDKAVAAALLAQKEAAMKAELSAEARHTDLVARLNTTAETLTEKITSLALRYEGTVGAGRGQDRLWAALIAAIGVVIGVASVVAR